MRIGRRVVAAIGLVVLTSAGCGRPSRPVVLPPEDLPFSVSRTSAPSPSPSPEATLSLFMERAGRLVRTSRAVGADVSPPEAAVRALLEGPTATERVSGMGTAIPPQTSLLEIEVLDQVADVDFSEEFQSPADPETIHLRIAQVVWTLVAIPDVTAVRFSIDGSPISVVTDSGEPVDRPVTAPDFASVAPTSP